MSVPNAGRPPGAGTVSALRERLILVGILSIGTFVRLYRIDLTWFFLDQVRDVTTASSIAAGESLPLLGPLIGWTHGHLGALYFYLVAVPFLLTRDPMAAVAFVVLANVLAIVFLHRFARQFFGVPVALIASALFAVFPLAVISARVLWNPALVPVFTLLFMRGLYAVIVCGHSRSIITVWAVLGVLTQLHLSTVALAAVAVLGVVLFRPRVRVRDAALGLGLFVVLYFPYLLHELSHRFENLRAFLFVAGPAQGPTGDRALLAMVKSLAVLYQPVLSGFVVADPWPPSFGRGFSMLYGIEAGLFVLGVVLGLYRLLRSFTPGAPEVPARRPLALLFLWIAVPVLLLGTRRTAIWWYYLDLLYPSQFIFVAMALSCLPSLVPRAQKVIAGAAAGFVVALVLSQGYFQVGLQRRIDRQGTIVLDVPRLSVSSEGSSLGVLTSLPYSYRLRILRTLLDDFHLEESAFSRRVHGPVLGLPEENEYLLRSIDGRVGGGGKDVPPPAAHYLVVRHEREGTDRSALRWRRIGPYAITEYEPAIDYRSWSYAVVSRGALDRIPEDGWSRLDLPARRLGVILREGEVLVWKGLVRVAAGARVGRLAVDLIGEGPLEVVEARSGKTSLSPVNRSSGQSPSLYWAGETVFDLTDGPVAGDIPILIAVAGQGYVLSVDVREASDR